MGVYTIPLFANVYFAPMAQETQYRLSLVEQDVWQEMRDGRL